MKKIKIMHITQSVGGVATYLYQVVQHIDKEKFELVIVSSEKEFEKFEQAYDIKYYKVKMSRGFSLLNDTKLFFSLRSILKKEKPAIVHLHTAKAGFTGRIVTKIFGYKSLFTPHGGSYLSFTGGRRMMFFMMEIIAKKFTYKLLAVSQTEARRFIYEVGIPKKDVYTIPNALTITTGQETTADKLNILKGKFKIGTIGRLTYQKDPLLFVDIANAVIKQNPDVYFYFLGAGFHDHLKQQVEEKIKEYAIANNVMFLNKGDHAGALDFLRQLDIFLLPSLYEGLPYALLEAMLAGVPCVVSKCDGNNDVISNNINGFSCLGCEEFSETILQLIDDPEMARSIGEKGKQFVMQKHDMRNAIHLLENIYTEMASF